MATSKDFSDTSASRYSLALYELAEESKIVDEIENHSIAMIKLISENQDFQSLIKDPTNSQDDQLLVVSKIFQNYKLNNLFFKFISFLISKRRFFYIEKILKEFVNICSKKRGEVKAELISAIKLSDNKINNIKEDLTKNFSSKIKLNYKYDESLIGGLTLQIGSIMIDTSIKNKLQQIENRMIEA